MKVVTKGARPEPLEPSRGEDPAAAFEAALARAVAASARATTLLRSVPRLAAPASSAGIRYAPSQVGGRPACLDVPLAVAPFAALLGLRPRSLPDRPTGSFEADTLAKAHAASLLRMGTLPCAPTLTFPQRPGPIRATGSERRAAFVGSPQASTDVARALGLALGAEGLPILPGGPLRLALLPFAEPEALARLSLEYGSSTFFEHARVAPLAPPFLLHLVAQRRFSFVDAADDALAPFLTKAGFRRHPDSSWVTTSPSAASAFRRFADPALRGLIEAVYARWPFIDDGFTLDDLEKVAGIPGAPSTSRKRPPTAPAEPRLHFDVPSGLFYTADAGLAAAANLDMLDPRDLTAIAALAGTSRRALFGSPFLTVVEALRREADDDAELEILARLVESAARPPLDPSWRPPEPAPAFRYDEDQVDGIRHAMRGPCVSIADEMGIGKSFEAVGFIDAVRAIHPTGSPLVLYVLPASQRDSITSVMATVPGGQPLAVRRLDGCGIVPRPANVAVTGAAPAIAPAPHGAVVVVSYETLAAEPTLLAPLWDAVVFDESHLIKNVEAGRTAAVIDVEGGGIRASRVVFMSGTQITNTMSDYWPMLRLLLRDAVTGRARFKALFAARPGPLGEEDPTKMARIARLARALDSGIRIRRTKEELGSTPGKNPPVIVEVPTDDPTILREAGREADILDSLPGLRDPAAVFEAKREINALRKVTGLAKIPFMVAELAAIAAREPVVAFTHHVDVAERLGDALAAAGVRVATLTGRRTTPAARFALVEAFQRGDYDAIVGTMSCAGVGYTMTRAAYCAVVELDWKAHIVTQAPDRLDRRGQTRKVTVAFYVFRRSFDSVVARSIVAKSRVADVANGDDLRRLRASTPGGGAAASPGSPGPSAPQTASALHSGVAAFANNAPA